MKFIAIEEDVFGVDVDVLDFLIDFGHKIEIVKHPQGILLKNNFVQLPLPKIHSLTIYPFNHKQRVLL